MTDRGPEVWAVDLGPPFHNPYIVIVIKLLLLLLLLLLVLLL